MALVGYARVSTRGQSTDSQMDALHAAGCTKIFVDVAGGTSERPELERALDYLREGDLLVVWRLDRLGRSLKHLIQVVDRLRSVGVAFRSLHEGIDTTSISGKLVFHVFGALAEFERELIRERTRVGLIAARARGRSGGRPKKLSANQAADARRMRAAGIPVDRICKTLQISRSTFYRATRLPDI